MTEIQQEKQSKNLIPKHNSLSQAILAGSVVSGASLVFGAPIEYVPRIALAGATWSLCVSWLDNRNQAKPRKRKSRGRHIPFNNHTGTQSIDMEYSVSQGGYVSRETWPDTFNRLIFGKKEARLVKPIEPVEKPSILSEFTFQSQGVQLLESEVKAFLQIAWNNRARGRGLSERFWCREISQRPGWFKSLGRPWYLAFLMLLVRAEKETQNQLVVSVGYQQHALKCDSRTTLAVLKWAEYKKQKK